MQTEDTNYIYWNDLNKPCFHHDIIYGRHKDMAKRTRGLA